jgi:hypothetical protein
MLDRFMLVRFVTALAIGAMVSFVGVGCGDDDNTTPQQDAGQHDVAQDTSTPPDVPPQTDVAPQQDAQADAGPKFSGTVAIYESAIEGIPQLGQGIVVSITFQDDYAAKPPTLEESPGQPTGCKVWEYTSADLEWAQKTTDEGSVQLTFTQVDTDAGVAGVVAPPCNYSAATGEYMCGWGQGLGGTWADGPAAGMKTIVLSNATPDITAAAVGSTLVVMPAPVDGGVATNAGNFPILAVPANNTLVVADLTGAATNGAETGAWAVFFGVMPSPGFAAEPGMMSNDQTVKVKLTAGGGNHITAFEETISPSVGDNFTMKATDNTTTPPTKALTAIPFDGTAFQSACDTCNTALGSIYRIVATDGDPTTVGPTSLPVGTKRVEIRCSYFGVGTVAVPAAYSAKLVGMKKAQATFMRIVPVLTSQMNLVGGHARAGYTVAP